jgi:threonine/homoserine/homoserine lactone efflux protein
MSLQFYLAYVAACVAITIVPGPTVSLIIANSMTHGKRAGLINIAGTQLGLAAMIGILLIGLTSLIATMGVWFDWVRLAGAAYLIWLGYKFLRAPGALGDPVKMPAPRVGFFWQGFLVLMSNPKALLLFGAFIPQFVDPNGNYVAQVVLLGVTAMAVAGASDTAYALLTGRARALLSPRRIRIVSRLSGGFLIGGGVWLAFARTR